MGAPSFELILVLLAAVNAVVLVVVFVRWYSRRHGRRPGRGLRRALLAGWADLASPLLTLARYRRGVRTVQRGVADPDRDHLLAQAAEAADRAGARAYAMVVAADDVAAGVVAPAGTSAPPGWRAGEDGWWHARREQLGGPVDAAGGTPVALGVSRGGLLWLDLGRVPGVLAVSGEARAAHGLVCAVAVQLAAAGPGVLVTAGVHPRFAGVPLARALDRVPDGGILITANPTEEGSAGIAALLRRRPDVRVVQVGDHPGSRWLLQVADGGRVRGDELGLLADSAPLERGVARAFRRSTPAASRPPAVKSAAPQPVRPAAPQPFPAAGPDLTEPDTSRPDTDATAARS
jgi:hypothetical protein